MNTQEKIERKYGYTSDYLPFGTYKNYTMIVALANYTTNTAVRGNALYMLDEEVSAKDKLSRLSSAGGFFHKVCTDTFGSAWNHADGSNRKALLIALESNELEL